MDTMNINSFDGNVVVVVVAAAIAHYGRIPPRSLPSQLGSFSFSPKTRSNGGGRVDGQQARYRCDERRRKSTT
jgi:hypothetical protein